jgi:hypothetical protein
MIGGFLADPNEQWPRVFHNIPLFNEYPYLLACSVAAIFPLMSMVAGHFLLDETLKRKPVAVPATDGPPVKAKPAPFRSLMTTRVLSTLTNYAVLAFMGSCFANLIPLFAFTCVAYWLCNVSNRLIRPHNDGGLNMTEAQIGSALSGQAIAVIFAQALLFPLVHAALGSVKLFRTMICCYPVAVILLPLANLSARHRAKASAYSLFGGALLLLACVPFPRWLPLM